MPRQTQPLIIPKDTPRPIYEAFHRLFQQSQMNSTGLAAVSRGEAPDGSGNSIVDLSSYFYLPGRTGGQVAFGSTQAAGKLTLSSTKNVTKGFIYLGSDELTATYDETNGFFGVGTIHPAARIHGVAVTGGGSTLLPSSDINTNFTRYTGSGGTPQAGTRYDAINTIDDDTSYLAQNVSNGVNPQICGLNGTATVGYSGWRVTYRLRTFAGSPLSGGAVIRFRIVLNNGKYYDSASVNISTLTSSWTTATVDIDTTGAGTTGGTANSMELYMPGVTNYCLITYLAFTPITTASVAAEAGTFQAAGSFNETVMSVRGGTYANVILKVLDNGKFFLEDQAGNGAYMLGTTDCMTIYAKSTSLKLLSSGLASAWSDSASSHFLYLGDLIGGTARRAVVSSTGSAALDRLGLSSTYTLISDAVPSNADFLTSTGSPMVRMYNTTTSDAVLELRGKSGLTGKLLEFYHSTTRRAYFGFDGLLALEPQADVANASQAAALLITYPIGAGNPPYAIRVVDPNGNVGLNVDPYGGVYSQILSILDTATGFSAQMSGSFAGDFGITIPDASATGQGTMVLDSSSQLYFGVFLATDSILRTNSNTVGVSFRDSTTDTKRLRMILSGAVGNNSFTLTNTASRNYGFGNLSGNVVIVGDDPPSVAGGSLGKVDLTAQTANIATTNLSSTPPAGMYHVEVTLVCTTADVTAGTLAVTIGWTDVLGATTNATSIAGFTLAATGRTSAQYVLQVASGNITYATTVTGAYGTSQYAIYVRVISLG